MTEKLDKAKIGVTFYTVKCSLCGRKMMEATSELLRGRLVTHIDDECEVAKTMRRWEEQGIYKQMMSLLREGELIKDLRKLLKHYSIEEIRKALETIELSDLVEEDDDTQ